MSHKLPKVLALLGPTGAGKTKLSIDLAKHYDACIINLDSVQMYKELNIGSAKPTLQELLQVKHYLVNSAGLKEPHRNSFWVFKESYELIKELFPKQNIVLTGGTGLYYKNLLWGMFTTPSSHSDIRLELEKQTTPYLSEKLSKEDPLAFSAIHAHDRTRIIRALEVLQTSGQSIITLRQNQQYTPPAPFLLLGVSYPREILYERINARVSEMLKEGLLEEVQNLYLQGYKNDSILGKFIGYKEFFPYLEGKESLKDCIEKLKQNTRRYAKRQLTLFRHIPNVEWFTPPELSFIIEYIEKSV